MRMGKFLRVATLAAWVTVGGCTTLRELPRADYAARPERKGVRVETREGLVFEFDSATFDPDSLTGLRLRTELDGSVDEVAMVRVALDDITRMRTRGVDWTRTGLIGGGVLAGVVAIGLVQAARGGSAETGGNPICTRCELAASGRR